MAQPLHDHYKALGIERNADGTEIKVAFYVLAKAKHPDKGGSHEEFLPVCIHLSFLLAFH